MFSSEWISYLQTRDGTEYQWRSCTIQFFYQAAIWRCSSCWCLLVPQLGTDAVPHFLQVLSNYSCLWSFFLFWTSITLLKHKPLLLVAAGMQTSLGSQLGLWSAAGPLWAVTNVSKKSYCRCYVDAIWVCLWRRHALSIKISLLCLIHAPKESLLVLGPVHDHPLVSSSIDPSIVFSLFIVFVSIRHKISAPPNNLLNLSTSPAPLRTSKRWLQLGSDPSIPYCGHKLISLTNKLP